MKLPFVTLSFLSLICGCESPPNKINTATNYLEHAELSTDTINIVLKYYGLTCDCPQWITAEDLFTFEESIDSGNTLPMDSLFIRLMPTKNAVNPFDLTDENTQNYIFEFTGQFYLGKHKWVAEDDHVYHTKIFNYFDCKLVKN